jgi:hypothetical protein
MKKVALFLLIIVFAACNNKSKAPDVSSIKIDLSVKRFDEDFFSMDTMAMGASLIKLQSKYPEFLPRFLQGIVGVNDPEGAKAYYHLYKPVFDSAQLLYRDFDPIKKQLEKAFQYVKYYFPSYSIPVVIIPIIGPMNSKEDFAQMENGEYTPNFIGRDFIGISLQFYLGKDFSFYSDQYFINNVAPMYRSRRFDKEYIAADVIKLIADDLFPDKSKTRPLIEQIIERGKQWWLVDKFLPNAPDSVKTGYTQHQLDWCNANEGQIWTDIVRNEKDLYTMSTIAIQTYIGEGPFTSVFSQEDSPGNIGPWIGRQIVRKFADKNSGMTIEQIMQASSKQILEEAKYKPK